MKRKIYRNLWAGNETYFIPTNPVRSTKNESRKIGGYGIVKVDGKWKLEKNAVYYSHDLKDPKFFPVVGEIDIEASIIQCIMDEVSRENKGKTHVSEQER